MHKDSELFIAALYEHLLGRKPDPSGLTSHSQEFEAIEAKSRYSAKISQFVSDAEARWHLGSRLIAAQQLSRKFESHGAPVDFLISAGDHCATSWLFKSWGLKRFTSPFDWLFSNPDMIAHCISNDFADFLDKRYLEVCSDAHSRWTEHVLYRERFGVRRVFNHYDVVGNSESRAYFERAIDRLRRVFRAPERKLFVAMRNAYRDTDHDFEHLSEAFERSCVNFEVIVISVQREDPEALLPSLSTTRSRPNGSLCSLNPLSRLGELQFENALDNATLLRFLLQRNIRLQPRTPV